jgi:hypothetical protein
LLPKDVVAVPPELEVIALYMLRGLFGQALLEEDPLHLNVAVV